MKENEQKPEVRRDEFVNPKYVRPSGPHHVTGIRLEQDECPQCEGTGMMPIKGGQDEIPCDLCDGTGSWVAPIRNCEQDSDEIAPF